MHKMTDVKAWVQSWTICLQKSFDAQQVHEIFLFSKGSRLALSLIAHLCMNLSLRVCVCVWT